ncbi:hypothetical protein CLU95_5676 [Variovorax sp. 54]|nr:hypothetical protein [Variovorax sp. 54]PIF78487.1 hypothetical protein CLU95_5676 [Variovorax sp. 54]
MNPPPTATVDPAVAEYKAARDKLSADYKTGRTACDAMKDNAKDVCVEEAKGKEKLAKADESQGVAEVKAMKK